MLTSMHLNNEISKECYTYLSSEGTRTSELYLLPKIHKNKLPPPGRPILSANGCPTERISQFVDFFLKPLVPLMKSYIKDTTHFLQCINENLKEIPISLALSALVAASCIEKKFVIVSNIEVE